MTAGGYPKANEQQVEDETTSAAVAIQERVSQLELGMDARQRLGNSSESTAWGCPVARTQSDTRAGSSGHGVAAGPELGEDQGLSGVPVPRRDPATVHPPGRFSVASAGSI